MSMTDVTIRIDTDQTVEIAESNLVVDFVMDKMAEVDQGMDKAIGITLGEEILEAIQKCIRIRILEKRITEVDIEEIIGMKIMKEVGVGLEKGCILITLERMRGVIFGQDQDQEEVPTETELGVISLESMIMLQKIALQQMKKERQIKYNRCSI